MKVQNYKGGKVTNVELDTSSFGDKVMHRLLKDAVVMYQANQRLGTAKTKTRAEVHGSHAKPWKQKHTGRARAGDKKSPLWRKGGTIFGPVPHDFSYHMPAQMRRVALRSAIAGKIQDSELVVAELPKLQAPSAKTARKLLGDLGSPRRVLIVLNAADAVVWKSFRNFPGVTVKTAAELNAHDVLAGGLMVTDKVALDSLAERVGTKAGEGTSKAATKTKGGGA